MSSRRQILRSTSLVGGAAAINIAIGLIRTKIAALLLGPIGIGEIGLFLNLVQWVATIGALGLGTSAVRQIADALGRNHDEDVGSARRAMLSLSAGSALLTGIVFVSLALPIGRWMAFGPEQATLTPWLGIAIAATILAGVPVALLIAYRQVVDQALVQIGGALLGTVSGLACLLVWGRSGIIGYTIAAPVTQLVSGIAFTFKLPRVVKVTDLASIRRQALTMIGLGIPFTVGALSMTGGLLALRSLLADRLGPSALGQFTAAWTLCVTYVGFVLQATGTDYFPRLSSVISDPDRANRTATEQVEISILISLPIIVAVEATSPWLLQLLYSHDFGGAVAVVRWQVLGDVFKIASTPIAYVMLASGHGKTYWLGETLAIAVLIGSTAMLTGSFGLSATGVSYLIMCAGYFAFSVFVAHRITGFNLTRSCLTLVATAFAIVLATSLSSMASPYLGLAVGLPLAAGSALFSIRALEMQALIMQRLRNLAGLAKRSRGPQP